MGRSRKRFNSKSGSAGDVAKPTTVKSRVETSVTRKPSVKPNLNEATSMAKKKKKKKMLPVPLLRETSTR